MIDEIERRLGALVERLVRERGIETPLTKPRDAKRVAESTYQAVAYVLRQYGMRRLNDPWLTVRLAEFSDAQIAELIAALGRMQPRYPAITDQLVAEIGKLREQT
jgi:transposase